MLSLYSSLSSARSGLRSIVKSGLQLFYKVNVTSGSVLDRSRNSNDGTLYSGKALDFDGTGDSITVGDTGINMKTVVFWIFVADVTSNTEQIMEFKTDHGISSVNGTITTAGTFTNKVIYVNGSAGSSISANTWSRIVVTTTAAIDVNQLVFGTDGSTSGTFVISDFQLYDKTWTASDVEFDYNNPDKDVFDNPNSSIVVTDCKSLLRLNEGVGDRVYDAAPVLGAEEVENGNFSTDSDWNVGTGWDIDEANNKATHTGTGGSIKQTLSDLIVGKDYVASVTLNSIGDNSLSNTSFQIRNNADAASVAELLSSSGNILANKINYLTLNFTATEVNNIIRVYSEDDIFVTDFSIKQLKPAESFVIVGDKDFTEQQPHIPQYAMSSFSKKMVFDGSDDYVTCGSDASIDDIFTGGGTFSAWISPTTDGGSNLGTIMGKGTVSIRVKDDDNEGVILNLAKGFSTTNADFLTSDEVVLENKMNHIAITYNDSDPSNTPSFYVNGVLKAIDTGSSTTPAGSASTDASSNLILGNVSAGGARSFDGIIDEVSLFDVELTQTEVLELFNSGSAYDSTTHSQSSNLNAYWRNNGAAQWDDLSTNTNHGTVSGSPAEIFLQEVPFFGKDSLGMFMNKPRLGGLNFNGSGYVNGGNDSSIKPASALSVECWIRTPDVSVTSKYISDAESGTSRFFLMQTGSKARFNIAGTDRDSAANLTNNTWHYIAGTWDGSTMTLYVDERTPVTVSKSGSISYNTDDLYIGTRLGTGEYYDGIIDDVRIYNKALTQAEISKNYNATKGRHKN